MKEEKQKTQPEVGEDATKYGEFVSSYFAWLTPERQKKRAEDLKDAGNKKKK